MTEQRICPLLPPTLKKAGLYAIDFFKNKKWLSFAPFASFAVNFFPQKFPSSLCLRCVLCGEPLPLPAQGKRGI